MKIPSYAKASEGYPPVAKSAEATSFNTFRVETGVTHSSTGRTRGFLRRRIKLDICWKGSSNAFGDQPGDGRRAELKGEELDKPRKRSGVTIFPINPVVALNSALGFIQPLSIGEYRLNQCHLLDHPIGDLQNR